MAEYRRYAVPHPQWKEFPKNLPPGTRVDRMTRDHLPIVAQEGLNIDELNEVICDDSPVMLRRYRSSHYTGLLPVLLFMHPGGFVNGGLETEDALCRKLALHVPIVVLSVEYRLAPEHPFPAGFNDCLAAVKWVTSQSGQSFLEADLTRGFILGGHSAGGNFTAGLAHTMLEDGLKPQPTGLLFMASSFCHPDVRPAQSRDRILSVDEIVNAPGLTVRSIKYFAEKYGAPPDDKRYSPLLYDSRKGLAKKAFFQICGWDPRRDEAILYSKLLNEDGIASESKIYPGLPHGFWTTCPDLDESKKAVEETLEGVKWLLES